MTGPRVQAARRRAKSWTVTGLIITGSYAFLAADRLLGVADGSVLAERWAAGCGYSDPMRANAEAMASLARKQQVRADR